MGTGTPCPALGRQQQATGRDLPEPAVPPHAGELGSFAGLEIEHAMVFEAVEDRS